VHGHKDGSRGDRPGNQGGKAGQPPSRSHFHPIAFLYTDLLGIAGMDFQEWMGMHLSNFVGSPGAGLRVPVAIETAVGQHEGIIPIGWFSQTP